MLRTKKGKIAVLVMVAILAITSIAFATYVYESRYGHNTLKRGHTGTYVANLQSDINTSGDGDCGAADGIFGSQTEVGVKQYQGNHNLTQDGEAGYNTKTQLWNQVGRYQ